MKKFLLFTTVACLALTGCEDVPAPYEIFSDGASVNPGDQNATLPEGDGTAANPFNVAGILEYVSSLEADVNSASEVYFKGKVSSVKEISPSYNNASFYLSDDGSTKNEFYVYRCLGVNKGKITSDDLVKKGDEVVMCGKVVNYKGNTPETVQKDAYIVSINGNGSSEPSTPDVPTTGAGSKNEPYNVASAQQNEGRSAWVEGYVVGYIDGQVYESGATFAVPAEAQTEIILADAADVKTASSCIPVQLPAGDVRSSLDLFANPSLLGQKVKVYGSLEKYFGVTGLKSTSCAIVGDKVIGKDPESTEPEPPVGDVKGTGTATDPYNVAGVLTYTKGLQSDVNSTGEIYFKGIVSSIKEISTVDNYNNATFYISDDGKSGNEFYIFRCLGLNKADITSAELVKVGDEVLICGKVVNYKGNTPETVQKEAWIVSINGDATSGETPVDPDPTPVDPTPDTPADPSGLVQNGDFEAWTNGLPDHWITASTAGNAKLEQSADAHGGKYAVQVNGTTANQRLGYQETVYAPGTYTMKFYAKALGGATSSYGPQCRPGYVPVDNGKVGTYVYRDSYETLSENNWTEVTYTFTLADQTTLCLVVMNAKNSGNILIDDFTISKQ